MDPARKGFVVLKRRWAVERTFGCLAHWDTLMRERAGRLTCVAGLMAADALSNPASRSRHIICVYYTFDLSSQKLKVIMTKLAELLRPWETEGPEKGADPILERSARCFSSKKRNLNCR